MVYFNKKNYCRSQNNTRVYLQHWLNCTQFRTTSTTLCFIVMQIQFMEAVTVKIYDIKFISHYLANLTNKGRTVRPYHNHVCNVKILEFLLYWLCLPRLLTNLNRLEWREISEWDTSYIFDPLSHCCPLPTEKWKRLHLDSFI